MSLTFHGHRPPPWVWSCLPCSHTASTQTLQRWPAGGRGSGGKGCMPQSPGKRLGGGAKGNRVLRPGVPVAVSHGIDPCSRRSQGYLTLSISPPDSSLGPRFLPGGPTSCANGVGHSGMSREPGKAGSAHRGWGGEEGVHTNIIRHGGRGEGLVGGDRGWGSAGVLGSC